MDEKFVKWFLSEAETGLKVYHITQRAGYSQVRFILDNVTLNPAVPAIEHFDGFCCAMMAWHNPVYLHWMAARCGFDMANPPVVNGRSETLRLACSLRRKDIVEWLFKSFDLATACSKEFIQEAMTLMSLMSIHQGSAPVLSSYPPESQKEVDYREFAGWALAEFTKKDSDLSWSMVASAAPSREIVSYILDAVDRKIHIEQFESCANSKRREIDLEFMQWLADRCGFNEEPPIANGECMAFHNGCLPGKRFDIARWMFDRFDLAKTCRAEFLSSDVAWLQSEWQSKNCKEMARWIIERIKIKQAQI